MCCLWTEHQSFHLTVQKERKMRSPWLALARQSWKEVNRPEPGLSHMLPESELCMCHDGVACLRHVTQQQDIKTWRLHFSRLGKFISVALPITHVARRRQSHSKMLCSHVLGIIRNMMLKNTSSENTYKFTPTNLWQMRILHILYMVIANYSCPLDCIWSQLQP